VLASAADAAGAHPLEVSDLWRELCDGFWKFVDTFITGSRCYAIFAELPSPRPPGPRLSNLLALSISGQSRKALAYEMNRSLSTISGGVQGCLRNLGLEGRHAPALLIMAACDLRRDARAVGDWRVSRISEEGAPYYVVSVSRPDLELPARLSEAETAVVRELVSGLSYAAIAAKRSTSVRTVANQIASAFRKLGVSGRQSMIEQLIARGRPTPVSRRAAAPIPGLSSPA